LEEEEMIEEHPLFLRASMKPYSTLTVRGQARRLRALALNALTHYALDVTCLRLVSNDLNGIFRIDSSV